MRHNRRPFGSVFQPRGISACVARATSAVRATALCATAGVLMAWAVPAATQTAVPAKAASAAPAAPTPASTLQIEGKTIDGRAFKLAALKGKVVLVIFWSTGCAVCRDKMPELRTNYEGWAGKPFELVAVNNDVRMQDFMEYERIISRTVPLKQRFVQLWMGDSTYKDSIGKSAQLPTTFLIDKSGKVIERYVGRIPSEAWDKIASLL